MSVFLTNKTLGFDYKLTDNQKNLKIDQLVSTLHSMSILGTDSQVFYISYDQEFHQYKELIDQFIEEHYSNPIVNDFRLETYSQWKNASDSVPSDIDFVLLQSNADHVYTQGNREIFDRYMQELSTLGSRTIGSISHWPEYMFSAMSPLKRTHVTDGGSFIIETTNTIGTCVVSQELFKEWWSHDFTMGSRIIRPDNVFGPSVTFPSAKMLIPNQELFRHLDGYGHVGQMESYASYLRPCCTISNFKVQHLEWKKNRIKEWKSSSDLPSNYLDSDANFQDILDYISWASSYKSNFSLIRLVRRAFKINAVKVLFAYLYYLSRRPAKWHLIIFEEIFIRFIVKSVIFSASFGKNPRVKTDLTLKFSQLIDLIHLRGMTFALKTRVKLRGRTREG
jgi:hypothetical protein